MTASRFLGLDYGAKRIGIAISDENGSMAFPKEILANDQSFWLKLRVILKNYKVSEIVIGESVDFSGKLNPLSGPMEIFILELRAKFKMPVHKQKEFLTSVEARRYIKSEYADASAAALILQRYLDKKHKKDKNHSDKNWSIV